MLPLSKYVLSGKKVVSLPLTHDIEIFLEQSSADAGETWAQTKNYWNFENQPHPLPIPPEKLPLPTVVNSHLR